MIKLLLPCLLCFLCLNSSAQQSNGFYGKKNFVEVSGSGHFPIFSNWISDSYSYQPYQPLNANSNSLILKKDRFDVGIIVSAGRAFKKNFGASFEFGMDFQSIPAPVTHYDTDTSYIKKHEALDVRTMVFMPKLEFANLNGLLPMGLNHQFGIGLSTSRIVDKDYVMEVDTNFQETALANLEQNYFGFKVMYALNMRTPLSKSLMLNYGFRYSFNWVSTPQGFNSNQTEYSASISDIAQMIRKRRLNNIICFNLGLTVPF